MTPEEKEAIRQIKADYANVRSEMADLAKSIRTNEVDVIGQADVVSLSDLKATVRVLDRYKKQGFKSIKL